MKTEKTNLENSYIGSADGRDVYTYRNSQNNPLSICILSDEPFSVEDAWDTLMEVYPDAGFKHIVFIEFDKGVAMDYNSQYAAVFHEYDLDIEKLEEDAVRTYDVRFNDEEDSNSKGFRESLEYCKQYIEMYNGSNHSYFADYKGGTVSIVCNETGETIHEEEIK